MATLNACFAHFHDLLQKHDAFSPAEWKSPLCQLVNQTIAEVSDDKNIEEYEYELTLDLIRHAFAKIDYCPIDTREDPPGYSLLDDSEEPNPPPESQEEKQFLALTYWVLTHLLRMIPVIGDCELTRKAQSTIHTLMQMIKPRDPFLFRLLVEELCYLLSDLVKIESRFFAEFLPEDFSQDIERFKNIYADGNQSGLDELVHRKISIRNLKGCVASQVAVTSILSEMAMDLCQFADTVLIDDGDSPEILWSTLCSQLENGEFQLKMVSLTLCEKLLTYSGLPPLTILDLFIEVMVSVADLLCQKQDDSLGDFKLMELQFSCVLEVLIESTDRPDGDSVCVSIVLENLSKGLMGCIIEQGTEKLRTKELKQRLIESISELQENLPDEYIAGDVMLQSRINLSNVLVAEIGSSDDLQYIEKFVSLTLMDELPDIEDVLQMVAHSQELVPLVDGREEPPRKRRLSKSYTQCREADYTTVLATSSINNALLVKFNKALDMMDELLQEPDLYVNCLEAMRSIVQIIVMCSASLHEIVEEEREEGLPPMESDTVDICSITLFNQELLNCLSKTWTDMLSRCASNVSLHHIANQCYQSIIKSIGAILSVQEFIKINHDAAHAFTWMITLPWLMNEVKWLDLKQKESSKAILKIARVVCEYLNDDVKATCVSLLGMFPKDVAMSWRVQVLKIVAGDSSDILKTAVVECIPYLVYHGGPNANHLVHDILHDMIREKSSDVQLCLAGVAGQLACIMSRQVQLSHESIEESAGPSYSNVLIQCSVCDPDEDEETPAVPTKINSIDPEPFLPFFDILQTNSPELKKAMIHSLQNIFMHLGGRAHKAAVTKMITTSLGLLQDDDLLVRESFSQVIKELISRHSKTPEASDLDNLIIAQLKKTLQTSVEKHNTAFTQTILHTVGEMAQVAEGNLLLTLIVILLENIISPPFTHACSVARSQMTEIAEKKQLKMRTLFAEFGKDIARILVHYLHIAQTKQGEDAVIIILSDVAEVFEYENMSHFIKTTESLLLPELVMKRSSAASSIIKLFAKLLGDPNHKGPLARNIRIIYCHIVQNCQPNEFSGVLAYLEKQSDWDRGSLLRYAPHMDSELLLHLSSHTQRVIQGMKILVKVSNDSGNRGRDINSFTEEDVVNFLQPKLLGILVHFDNYLNKGVVGIEEKKKAYKSIVALMQLMGPKNITAVRVRIMTTLKIGLKFKDDDFPELCCRVWNRFVKIIEPACLGPMLSSIVVSLLPLLQTLPKQVSDIFDFLIIDNKEFTKDHYQELYFLPDIPDLADARATMKEHIDSQGEINLKGKIENLLQGVRQESVDVQILALKSLKRLLHEKQLDVQVLVLGNETADPIISQIVVTLLHCCRHSTGESRSLFGEVIGELGAIDPGRLCVMENGSKETSRQFKASMMDEHFSVEFISELCKAFVRADDRKPQDCVAFAIQEAVKIYQITNREDCHLWRRFSLDIQEIMLPLFQSKYMLQGRNDWSNLKKPIYGTRKGNTFHKWVCCLTGFLSSKVQEAKVRALLDKCCGVIENDSKIALYLLPHVVIHVLLGSDEAAINDLLLEIDTVLTQVRMSDSKINHTSMTRQDDITAQTIFSVLDHVSKYCRYRMKYVSTMATSAARARPPGDAREDDVYKKVKGFLDRVSLDTLAYASSNCEAFTRSLMHYEQFLKSQQDGHYKHEQLDFLQKLYKCLEEPDGVSGVLAIKQEQATLQEQINVYESIGQLSSASVCYDKAIQAEPNVVDFRQGLLKCRLDLGELCSALDLANGMVSDRPEWESQLNPFRVEAAWKLGEWDQLDTFQASEKKPTDHWSVGVGRLLLAARNKEEDTFTEEIKLVRNFLMGPLCAASMESGSYHRGYEYIVRLHMLNELEVGVRSLLDFPSEETLQNQTQAPLSSPVPFQNLLKQWDGRLQFTTDSYRTQEPILNLRRTLLSLVEQSDMSQLEGGVHDEIGKCWLKTAKIARQCGLTQSAHSFLLSASRFNQPELALEHSRWYWDTGELDKAQGCLERAIEKYFKDRSRFKTQSDAPVVDAAERQICAEMLLELGQMYEKTASLESNDIVKQYKEVKDTYPDWEDAHFYLGNYYNKLMQNILDPEQQQAKSGEFKVKVIEHFGMSLQHGNKYIYQTMPRILTMWLDFGAEVVLLETKKSSTSKDNRSVVLKFINQLMENLNRRLAPYQFLTAFPQLVSRICHTHQGVYRILSEIIASLLVRYPQQAMWMMMAVSKSSYEVRSSRCSAIINKAKADNANLHKFFNDATRLTDRLLDLCNKPCDKSVTTLSIREHFKPLLRLLNEKNFSQILIPLQRLMMPMLPPTPVQPHNHKPFPQTKIYIRNIDDTVEVLSSLQKPKKVTFVGSDGNRYTMLCKPKDDLRKDARLMEFNAIVNRLLRQDREARRRNLQIRTFTVTPLNEECGLLEWVPNTQPLRPILNKIYKERGIYISGRDLNSMRLPATATPERKRQVFVNMLLPRHPPVFSEWFLEAFQDPTSWYNARLSYCRTAAVMSMVGYILGLGDRHGENILVDSTTGDVVHVDFNCLFNKGETFEFPEVVPFRLTHNMIDAMGPLGYEGPFRQACEVTLRKMREEMDSLATVLQPFIYDPLVEWSKPAKVKINETGEVKNEKAQVHMTNIEARLRGELRSGNKTKARGLPLSVEGHVNHLINNATSIDNLAAMYLGWAAYM